MIYKALYRRFRPQIFEDVIGQDPIITTLKNQIKSNNISHAYLFCGTRGTGKTSTARIFARAVNCSNPQDFNPCNKCSICNGILDESIMDIVEIDAASNRGVENIRELRETVKYPPSRGKYKVYIIDEVHMLTTEAFNALLKTLEEPPKHIIFILATTDPQKLPPTILSRCQRFDFKSVTTKDIVKGLRNICKELQVEVEEDALNIIAINASGALRDALSILEQCISFSDKKISTQDVVETLGIVNQEILLNLANAIGEKNSSEAIYIVQKIIEEGKDVQQLIKDLIRHFRNLIMIKMEVELEELQNLSQEVIEKLEKQGKLFDSQDITEIIYTLSDTEAKAKYAAQPRILLEVAIISLCQKKEANNIESLISRIRELEEKLDKIADGFDGISKINHQPNVEQVIKRPQKEEKIVRDLTREENKETIKEDHNKKSVDFIEIQNKWEEIKEFIKQDKKAQIEALLKEGNLEGMRDDVLIISFKDGYGFHRETLDQVKNKEYIIGIIEKITGQKIRLSLIMEYELGGNKSDNKDEEEEFIKKLQESVPSELLEIYDE